MIYIYIHISLSIYKRHLPSQERRQQAGGQFQHFRAVHGRRSDLAERPAGGPWGSPWGYPMTSWKPMEILEKYAHGRFNSDSR